MSRIPVQVILLAASLLLPFAATHSEVFLVCKLPSTGLADKGACINAYNPKPDKVCSGKGEATCSTTSLADLCIKVGKKVGIPFEQYSSGLGTFKTEAACLRQCEKEYGGRFKKFGGECFGTVSK